jgi:hypothetical protein
VTLILATLSQFANSLCFFDECDKDLPKDGVITTFKNWSSVFRNSMTIITAANRSIHYDENQPMMDLAHNPRDSLIQPSELGPIRSRMKQLPAILTRADYELSLHNALKHDYYGDENIKVDPYANELLNQFIETILDANDILLEKVQYEFNLRTIADLITDAFYAFVQDGDEDPDKKLIHPGVIIAKFISSEMGALTKDVYGIIFDPKKREKLLHNEIGNLIQEMKTEKANEWLLAKRDSKEEELINNNVVNQPRPFQYQTMELDTYKDLLLNNPKFKEGLKMELDKYQQSLKSELEKVEILPIYQELFKEWESDARRRVTNTVRSVLQFKAVDQKKPKSIERL